MSLDEFQQRQREAVLSTCVNDFKGVSCVLASVLWRPGADELTRSVQCVALRVYTR
jgi:hypothetical protein